MSNDLAEALAQGVARHGADTVFGLPGGGPNLAVVGAAQRAGLRFVLAHAETAACIMASTYGLLSGRTALAVATRGPGTTSAVNGAAQATLDRSPLLLVTDCVPLADRGRVAHQLLDQRALMTSVTKWSGLLGRDAPGASIAAALALAVAPPAGAVHLDFDEHAAGDRPPPVPAEPPDDPALTAAAALVAAAHRPVAIVGVGALPWAATVRDALRASGWPVLTTYQAAGVLPSGDPQLAGLFTNGAIERPLLERADLVVAVGLDPVEPMPSPWPYEAPVLALHAWPPSTRYHPTEVEVVAALGPALARLTASAPASGWLPDEGQRAKRAAQDQLRSYRTPGLDPLTAVDAVAASAPDETTVTVDAGAHFLAVMPLWPAPAPGRLLISNGLATMGFALPAAIGAALARPDHPVVCFTGDGGLAMVLAELETLARLRLAVTVVVFNDSSLSLIAVKQGPDHGGDAAVRFRATDFAAIARAMGVEAYAVDTVDELDQVLARGWDRPRLIDARIDPSPYPSIIRATRG